MPGKVLAACGTEGSCCTSATYTGARSYCAAAKVGFAELDPPLAQRLDPLGAHAKGGFGNEDFFGLVKFVDHALVSLRQLHRPADDGGEHGVEIERGIDRARHFLERLQFPDRAGQLVRPLLQFAEQPRILDRDHRLIGEGAHQFDLPLAEQLDPFPRETNRADHGPFAQQRHPKNGTSPGRHSLGPGVVRVGQDVRDMHHSAFEQHPPGEGFTTGDNCSLAPDRPILGVQCKGRYIAVDLALAYGDRSDIGAAKPARRFGHRVQHRLHIGGRAADDVEHLAGRGLVFERLLQIVGALPQIIEQPCILDRNHRLVGESGDEFDLCGCEGSHGSPGAADDTDRLAVSQDRHAEKCPVAGERL